MHKVIVIRHSDDQHDTKYAANVKQNEDGSYTATLGSYKDTDYHKYIDRYGKHFNKKLCQHACKQMVNYNGTSHTWTADQIQSLINVNKISIPSTSTIYDIAYTANMAYADFYPSLINERQCLDYAMAVANDEDGYEGIQFCRYIADIMGKDDTIDWNNFI